MTTTQKKGTLNDIRDRKETLFESRRIVSQEIKSLFDKLKKFKEMRDEHTKKVHELKIAREALNVEIKHKISQVKGATGPKVPVAKIKKEIEKLQYYLETNPLSPEKEKGVMKSINEKEKMISKSVDVPASPEIEALKNKSNEIHAEIQTLAKTSQENHEKIIDISKDIKILKAREKDIHALFTDAKESYKGIKESRPKKKTADKKNEDDLKERQNEVEEKIKNKQKLTTEDLLAFRG
jgi:uncharacterized coiled-coil DUF342 family protein